MLSFDTTPHQLRLAGDWQVIAQPLDTEVAQGIACVPAVDFDAPAITVPECANLQPVLYPERPYWGDHLREMNEQAWFYRKMFTVPDSPFGRARLRFEGVDYHAEVWVNDQYVGGHEGSFVPFTLDVTAALQPGAENTLLVRVSAPWDKPNPRGSYPINHVLRGLVKGHYEHGEGVIPPNVNPLGIWRPVHLLLDDGLSVDRVQVYPALDGRVQVVATVTNAHSETWAGTLDLQVTAENHDGPGAMASINVEVPPGEQEISAAVVVQEPRLWWPWDHGDPNLYRLVASLQAEDGPFNSGALTTVFGIRTVRLERSPERFTWIINERPVFLRGSSYMPGLYLGQLTPDDMARDVTLARQANLNLLRVHVHVSPPEVYDLCDRAGILIWQDFELNWVQDPSYEFEIRARRLQHDMIAMLFNHPAILTWTCHNEPTMVFAHRENFEQNPDPALYADALAQDSTRPVFICSGQMEDDWQRAGDIHTYYGAMWSKNYIDVYQHHMRMNTEFGFEAPAALETLQQHPEAWERLAHLEDQLDDLWAYQAELVQYHVEHLRRTRVTGSAGYVHFWLADLVPQVGCGVLDSDRRPKGGYAALQRASAPLQVSLEHDGKRLIALWVFNDTPQIYEGLTVSWRVLDAQGQEREAGSLPVMVGANEVQRIMAVDWTVAAVDVALVELTLQNAAGETVATNAYERPLQPMTRPAGYPWKFDPYLGYKVFDRPDAESLVDQSDSALLKAIPLGVREAAAEWGMRQKLPLPVVSFIAKLTKPFVSR